MRSLGVQSEVLAFSAHAETWPISSVRLLCEVEVEAEAEAEAVVEVVRWNLLRRVHQRSSPPSRRCPPPPGLHLPP